MPYARQTDTFADGNIQIVELDVGARASGDIVGKKLRDARLPGGSRVEGIIRGGRASSQTATRPSRPAIAS